MIITDRYGLLYELMTNNFELLKSANYENKENIWHLRIDYTRKLTNKQSQCFAAELNQDNSAQWRQLQRYLRSL